MGIYLVRSVSGRLLSIHFSGHGAREWIATELVYAKIEKLETATILYTIGTFTSFAAIGVLLAFRG